MPSLVVQTSYIGDVILTTPLIAELAQRDVVDVVTTPAGASILRNNPHVRHLVTYDKRHRDRGVHGFMRVARQLSALRDGTNGATAYFAQGSLRSAALATAAWYGKRVGFNTSGGKFLYTDQVEYHGGWHHTRRLLSLLGTGIAASASASALRPQLFPDQDDIAKVDALAGERSRSFAALAPGSVWATKRWPYYEELAILLAKDPENTMDIALVGGPDDRSLADGVVGALHGAGIDPSRIIDAVGKLSLLGSAELIRRAAVIVTNDSSPQHLASAMDTPTITIFGPTVPAFGFGPLATGSRTVGVETLPCRPCDRHGPRTCPLGHWKCMRDLPPHLIAEHVRETMLSMDR